MRTAAVVSLLVATACMGSVKDRALALRAKVASLDLHVDPRVVAIAQTQLPVAVPAQPVAEPAQDPQDPPQDQAQAAEPAQHAPAAVPVVVHRVERATPSVFVARYQAAHGWTCQKFATVDACNHECTSRIALAAKMGGSTQCSCTQDAACN